MHCAFVHQPFSPWEKNFVYFVSFIHAYGLSSVIYKKFMKLKSRIMLNQTNKDNQESEGSPGLDF